MAECMQRDIVESGMTGRSDKGRTHRRRAVGLPILANKNVWADRCLAMRMDNVCGTTGQWNGDLALLQLDVLSRNDEHGAVVMHPVSLQADQIRSSESGIETDGYYVLQPW